MRIKITASTIWTVAPEDEEMAKVMLIDTNHDGYAIDYLLDSLCSNAKPELSSPETELIRL